jgi:hypothetical protein
VIYFFSSADCARRKPMAFIEIRHLKRQMHPLWKPSAPWTSG